MQNKYSKVMIKANVYRVMVGVPSKIKKEVKIVQKISHDWNKINSEKQKIALLPLHWSMYTHPAVGLQHHEMYFDVIALYDIMKHNR